MSDRMSGTVHKEPREGSAAAWLLIFAALGGLTLGACLYVAAIIAAGGGM